MRIRTYVSLLLFTLISHFSYSQIDFNLGLKLGANLSNIDTEVPIGETYESSLGYHGGLFATIKISKFAIQPELIFSKQGAKVTDVSNNDLKIQYTYLNLPIIAKVFIAKSFNLQFGPQIGWMTLATKDGSGSGREEFTDQLKSTDLSLCLGAGLDLPLRLNIDARYILGLSDINNVNGANSIKNNMLQLSIGYRFLNK